MGSVLDDFVEEARAVSIEEAVSPLGLKLTGKRHEHPQPCPVCGGTDTFAFNTSKNTWNCRHGGAGGRDAIGMAAHVLELDLRTREGLLEACAAVTGRDIPEGGERETQEQKIARETRLAERRRENEHVAAQRERDQNSFRDLERNRARGIVSAAVDLRTAAAPEGRFYLQHRGCAIPDDAWLRFSAGQTYWHGQDERGQPTSLYSGPAIVASFVRFAADLATDVIGCHITWIDLSQPPKFRPALFSLTDDGARAGRPVWAAGDMPPSREDLAAGLYEMLPTKKMRGTKKGGVIPLAGQPSATRWLGAEGIENTLAFARFEQFRADTFYFAAGDLGNMAGPADPASRFAHPDLKKADRNGRLRAVMVAGPIPLRRDGGEPDAMEVPAHVDELVLLADGDSERVMTAAAMARARARHARPGRLIPVVWPKRNMDFAAMLAGRDEAYGDGGAAA